MELKQIKGIVEAGLMVAGKPLNLDQLHAMFDEATAPDKTLLSEAVGALKEDFEGRAFELVEVASGYRVQVKQEYASVLGRLNEEKPPKYSRALLETLALVAYRQPVTRAEIEEIRGVSVSSNIVRTLLERDWIRTLGHRDVPGKPAIYGTTRQFLDYFGLASLDELPSLAEVKQIDELQKTFEFEASEIPENGSAPAGDSDVNDGEEDSDLTVTLDVGDENHEFALTAEEEENKAVVNDDLEEDTVIDDEDVNSAADELSEPDLETEPDEIESRMQDDDNVVSLDVTAQSSEDDVENTSDLQEDRPDSIDRPGADENN